MNRDFVFIIEKVIFAKVNLEKQKNIVVSLNFKLFAFLAIFYTYLVCDAQDRNHRKPKKKSKNIDLFQSLKVPPESSSIST